MHFIIYKTTNIINNKFYIGKHKTKNINDNYLGSGKYLVRAIKKYGVSNFKKEILYTYVTEEKMNEKEKEMVTEEFCLRKDTYNLCVGGHGGWSYVNRIGLNHLHNNRKNSLENLKKGQTGDTSFHKKLRNDPKLKKEWSQKISNTLKGQPGRFKGKKHKEESKRKIGIANSIKQLGELNSQFGTCWIFSEALQKSKKIKLEELNNYIENEWKKGRKLKRRAND